jgi:hypothetical protein
MMREQTATYSSSPLRRAAPQMLQCRRNGGGKEQGRGCEVIAYSLADWTPAWQVDVACHV